jgi:signal transduction histidine kinase
VDTFIQEVAATVQSTLNNDKVKIIPKVAPDIPSLITDREKLRQIALNLLDNAVKFTESGEIKIAAAQCNGALKLAVSDTGIGIAEEDLHHLFEEFYRGKSATRGTGLGLAIVKRFVSVLGGEIAVESEMGKGSTFIVTLPLEQSKHATIYSEKLAS